MHVNALARLRLAAGILATVVAAAVAVPGQAASPPASGRAASAKPAPATAVDVNSATAAELESVPGIGKALAQRIVEFREKNGPFGQLDDLVKVRGIGEKSIVRLRPYLTVGAAKGR